MRCGVAGSAPYIDVMGMVHTVVLVLHPDRDARPAVDTICGWAGDRVTVTYYQAIAAQVVNVFSSQSQPFEGVSVDRRETAERPGAQVTRVRRGRVTITAVDPSRNTISFVGPANAVRTVSPKNEEVASFIRKLKVGDQVDIVYEEALAISVEPMR